MSSNDPTQKSAPDEIGALFDDAPFGVLATDDGGVIVYVNRRQCENSEMPREAFLGKNRRATFGASLEKNGVGSLVDDLEDHGKPFEFTAPRFERQSDGMRVALTLRGYRYRGFNVIITSIDPLLAKHVTRYEQLFANAQDGIFIISGDGYFVESNQAFADIVGLSVDELVGQTSEVFLPGRFEASLARIQQIFREGRLGPYELEISTPRGKRIVSLNGFAMYENGAPVAVMNIARDVTERRLAERALGRETSFVRLLKDIAVAANEACSMEAALRSVVERVCAFTDCPVGHVYDFDEAAQALVPTGIWHLADAERFAAFRRVTEATRLARGTGLPGRVLASGEPTWIVDVTSEPDFPRAAIAEKCGLKSGFAFPVLVGPSAVAVLEFFSPQQTEPDPMLLDLVANIGTQLGRVVERERSERALAAARDQALQSAQSKAAFLASMSHEIRTPLNGVIGMAGLLIDTELAADQREYAETIRSCADSLLELINDILDFSKIEAGKLAIEPIPFDLETAVTEVAELFALRTGEKQLDLVLRYAPGTPSRVIGDPGRVRQILTNLVNNAIKFTDRGEVRLEVATARRDADTAWIRFSVADSGIGIAPEKQGEIFERFTQADASTTRRYGGTGLGLAISKQLVELMGGGEIGLESAVGLGSTFSFVLPLALDPATSDAAPAKVASLAGVRVLVVEDNASSRRVLDEILVTGGLRPTSLATAADAIAALRRELGSGDPFAIAIVDQDLPGATADALASTIKGESALRDLVLVRLAGPARRDLRRIDDARFAGQVTKPVRRGALLETLSRAWAEVANRRAAVSPGRSGKPDRGRAGDAGEFANLRVLLVEDNIVNQKVAALLLGRLGCRVDAAANGKEAVEMVQRIPYDLVLMDCQMPVMDGYAATREIRRLGKRLPIVAMTAHAMQGDRERCLEAGMDDYTTKPAQRDALELVLRKYARPADRTVPVSFDRELIDTVRWALAEAGESFVRNLVEEYVTGAKRQVAVLEGAVTSGDAAALRDAAHALKGSSATIGARAIADLCAEIEKDVRGQDVAATIARVGREVGRLEAAVDGLVLAAA